MLTPELKQKIDSLWDAFWSNGMSDHMNALKHISYLIFFKKLEDYENDRIIAAKKSKKTYDSIFEDSDDSMRWSVWKNYSGEKMLKHVRDKVFPFVKQIKSNGRFRLDLGKSNFEIPSPILLQKAVQVIDDLHISEQNLDTQGDIFEYVTSHLKTAGLNGQFRTPRHIIRMMIELIDPDVNQKICDPACGTAGFLINAYLHILKKYTSKNLIEIDEEGVASNLIGDKLSPTQRKFLQNEQLYGFDYETPMIQISQMNLILHGFKSPNVTYQNSVGKEFEHDEEYQIILANPPFAGNLNESEINEDFPINTTKTELLFIELFYKKLLVGGQAAIIVPSGVLSSSSNAHLDIRKLLLEKCQLEAVITMPSGVFKPYSGVSTAVLIFTKGGKTNQVWFYEMKKDGYTLDEKRELIDGKGDIPDIIKKFTNKIKSKNSFFVSVEKIKKNDYKLFPTNYKDQKFEQQEQDTPIEILDDISKLEKMISKDIDLLKKSLTR